MHADSASYVFSFYSSLKNTNQPSDRVEKTNLLDKLHKLLVVSVELLNLSDNAQQVSTQICVMWLGWWSHFGEPLTDVNTEL